jgi:hypothetical protein
MNQVPSGRAFTSRRPNLESGGFRFRRSFCPRFACGSCNARRASLILSFQHRPERRLIGATCSVTGLYRVLRRAGLRRVDMHSLRHSFASALIIAGAPVTEVQYLLGHSSPQTMLKVYSHWFTSTDSDSVHRLSRTLAGNFGHFLDTLGRSGGSARIVQGAEVSDFIEKSVAPPAGFEPTAPGLGILCSVQLS